MILFVDTETSGLPNYDLPVAHPSQPRIVQLAAWLGDFDDDGNCVHVASLNAVIRPDGWTISPGAEAIHRISTAYARAFGEPATDVMRRFYTLCADADTPPGEGRIVAHNFKFDNRMLLSESEHAGIHPLPLVNLRPFCTMTALTPRMKLPARFAGKYKWPNLDEAWRYCFPAAVAPDASARHTAMGDLLQCKDIFLHGRQEEWWT